MQKLRRLGDDRFLHSGGPQIFGGEEIEASMTNIIIINTNKCLKIRFIKMNMVSNVLSDYEHGGDASIQSDTHTGHRNI